MLELGAGAGRITHCLLSRGLSVVAVDESAEMLARIHGAEKVVDTIEGLDLHRRFDVVLLASNLVNVPDDEAAVALLATCARHVTLDGVVLIERHPEEWFDGVGERDVERDGIVYGLHDIVRETSDSMTATATYTIGDRRWTHTFTTRCVTDELLLDLLARAGLKHDRYLDDRRSWVAARRA